MLHKIFGRSKVKPGIDCTICDAVSISRTLRITLNKRLDTAAAAMATRMMTRSKPLVFIPLEPSRKGDRAERDDMVGWCCVALTNHSYNEETAFNDVSSHAAQTAPADSRRSVTMRSETTLIQSVYRCAYISASQFKRRLSSWSLKHLVMPSSPSLRLEVVALRTVTMIHLRSRILHARPGSG
ncbi:hypothetical protein MRB53_036946 [Persea americana]|nr:hypothetical protein MRB53_036946 [Persea americana]